MMRIVVAIVLAMASAACAHHTTSVASSPGSPGTRRFGAYPVRVDWGSADASGVVVVSDGAVCRVPCTVWLRADEEAVVHEESPAHARMSLPHIPGLDTYDVPPRVVVTPVRGHPGAAVGFTATGALMSLAFVPATIATCGRTRHGDSAGDTLCPFFGALSAISVAFLAVGLVFVVTSAFGSAEVAASPHPTDSARLVFSADGVGLHF